MIMLHLNSRKKRRTNSERNESMGRYLDIVKSKILMKQILLRLNTSIIPKGKSIHKLSSWMIQNKRNKFCPALLRL